MMRRALRNMALVGAAASGLALSSCGPAAFDSQSLLDTVRILSTSATEPYAKPGDSVTVNMLAVDARPARSGQAPMKVFWVPFVCEDPKLDEYYACFNGSATSSQSQSQGSLSQLLQPGKDLSAVLPSGPSYTFTMPADAITQHVTTTDVHPYGLAILFNAACAGHIQYTPPTSGTAQGGIPLGCFDDAGNQLGADDFVFGFTRVYAYSDITNANPVISGVTFNGAPVDMNAGATIPVCHETREADCPDVEFDVSVPESSWESNPLDVDPSTGATRHEEIYAEYFATFGLLDSDSRLLYDVSSGKVDDTAEKFRSAKAAADGTMYIVVHDSRGGASWTQLPIHAR